MPKLCTESHSLQRPSGNKLALPYARLMVASPLVTPPTTNAAPMPSARQLRAARTPRPANAWIVFRRANVQGMVRQIEEEIAYSDDPAARVNQADVSKRLGKIWSGLSDEEKLPYFARADVEKEEHARKYPDYRFAPRHRFKAAKAAGEKTNSVRKFKLAPPIRSASPTVTTSTAQQQTSDAVLMQQTVDDFMQWLDLPSLCDDSKVHLDIAGGHPSDNSPLNAALNSTEPFYQGTEVPASYSQAEDSFYQLPSGFTTTPASSMYPTPTPSPPHLQENFLLNDWSSPFFGLL